MNGSIPLSKKIVSSGRWVLLLTRGFSFVLYIVLRYVIRYRYPLIRRNLSRSFPLKSPGEIQEMQGAYYRHISDLFLEPFMFYLVPASFRNQLVTFSNLDLLHSLYKDNRHVVLLASHYGNWEYLINLPSLVPHQIFTAYTPLKSRLMDDYLFRLRSRFGVLLIPRKLFYRQAVQLLRSRERPNLCIVIGDQRPATDNQKHYLSFLNQHTAVHTGAERIAIATRSVVLSVVSEKISRFHYRYSFKVLADAAEDRTSMAITRAYFDELEHCINRSPVYWLWSHDRWKEGNSQSPQAVKAETVY